MNYLDLLESYHDDMIKTLGEMVAIPSVNAPAVMSKDGEILPFGKNVDDAFKYLLRKGEELGFTSCNADNQGGHLEFAGDNGGEAIKTFGITGHVDVVPESTGWNTEPYVMAIKDGNVYGRGVADDKGPVVAALYAMKAIKEAGITPKMNIRLIIGLDEEISVEGIEHYLNKVGQPDLGFTPDGDFPLVNGEKGVLIFELAQKLTKQTGKDGLRLTKIESGTASNAVPASAKAVVTGDDAVYETIKDRANQFRLETGYTLTTKKQGSSLVIESTGKAAHGAQPQDGLNAISIMMDFLGRLSFSNDEINDYIGFYNEFIGYDLNGERLGCQFSDDKSGKLTVNVGIAAVNEELASLKLNLRYPVTYTSDQVYEAIEEKLEKTKIGLIRHSDAKPLYMEPTSPLVEKLMKAYREETGDTDAKPIVLGGGTYAKAIDNTLAFGGLFPGEEDTMHQANERMSIESFYKMARIFARAIYDICC